MQIFSASRSMLPIQWLTRLLLAGFTGLLVSPAPAAVVIFLPLDPGAEIPNLEVEIRSSLNKGHSKWRPILVSEAKQLFDQDDSLKAIPAPSRRMVVLQTIGTGLGETGWEDDSSHELPMVETTATPPASTPLTSVEAPDQTQEKRPTATIVSAEKPAVMATPETNFRELVSVLCIPHEDSAPQNADFTPARSYVEPSDLDPWSFLEELDADSNAVASQPTEPSAPTLENPEWAAMADLEISPNRDEVPNLRSDKHSTNSNSGPAFLRPAMLVAAGVLEQASRRLETWAELISLAGQARLASTAPTPHN